MGGRELPERPRLKPHCRVTWDEHREKHLLLYPEGALVLNPTGHSILEALDGERDLGQVVETLASEYDEDPDIIRSDVEAFLAGVNERGLLTGASDRD